MRFCCGSVRADVPHSQHNLPCIAGSLYTMTLIRLHSLWPRQHEVVFLTPQYCLSRQLDRRSPRRIKAWLDKGFGFMGFRVYGSLGFRVHGVV